ncbi:NAD(P)-dependent dehydrogenase (short-subunit alcohol dehydrogenase family) [Streptomyces sp. 846.5]|nr:oxidoreductase [Streptomyces sp. 846.5]TDU02634.1 NAD(P)-dependent dehydrogenase (short-subunit alcohol dehydrogenase family) [Streptomyces sp. 846.5]
MATETWTPARLPDLYGRTAVVTGASSGLGADTARALAGAGARVVLAVRDPAKGRAVAARIDGETEVRALDLGDLASVRAFAGAWTEPLDLLINNAGIMAVPLGRTVDGFELQIGTNHLGHFALTNLLLPHIRGRVVTVSSGLARRGRIDLDDLNWERRSYRPWQAYSQSKLANLLFTLELQRRLGAAHSEVRAMSAHPGVAATGLTRSVGRLRSGIVGLGTRLVGQRKPEYGALPTLYAATQDLPGGSYVGPGGRSGERPREEEPVAAGRDPEVARRLWDLSEKLTGVTFPG